MDAKAKDAKAKGQEVPESVADPAETDADVEGHSVFSALAASGALRANARIEGPATRNKANEVLPPLSKPFPSMREDRRK